MYILQIVHWNPDKTTGATPYIEHTPLCISFKLFIEILIKQRSKIVYMLNPVVYILQIVHWNPDKTTVPEELLGVTLLCISFKLFIEILIKQPAATRYQGRCVVYILQIVHWNPDKTTYFVFVNDCQWLIKKVRIKKRRRFLSSAFLFLSVFVILK